MSATTATSATANDTAVLPGNGPSAIAEIREYEEHSVSTHGEIVKITDGKTSRALWKRITINHCTRGKETIVAFSDMTPEIWEAASAACLGQYVAWIAGPLPWGSELPRWQMTRRMMGVHDLEIFTGTRLSLSHTQDQWETPKTRELYKLLGQEMDLTAFETHIFNAARTVLTASTCHWMRMANKPIAYIQ